MSNGLLPFHLFLELLGVVRDDPGNAGFRQQDHVLEDDDEGKFHGQNLPVDLFVFVFVRVWRRQGS